MARAPYSTTVYRWGDWARARSIFHGLAFRMNKASESALWDEVQAAAERIKHNIAHQNYPHVPLSDWQREYKAARGLDPRILMETGSYRRAITAFHLGRGAYAVGVPNGDKENVQKGLMHEWGGVNNLGHKVPARPHYRVEMERIRTRGVQSLKKYLHGVLEGKAYLGSSGGKVIGVDGP